MSQITQKPQPVAVGTKPNFNVLKKKQDEFEDEEEESFKADPPKAPGQFGSAVKPSAPMPF
jgi:hypothetical protein